jgi:hypothetical protein
LEAVADEIRADTARCVRATRPDQPCLVDELGARSPDLEIGLLVYNAGAEIGSAGSRAAAGDALHLVDLGLPAHHLTHRLGGGMMARGQRHHPDDVDGAAGPAFAHLRRHQGVRPPPPRRSGSVRSVRRRRHRGRRGLADTPAMRGLGRSSPTTCR